MTTKTTHTYDVDVTLPGSREWCEGARQALIEMFDRLANSAQREALGVMPALRAAPAEDDSGVWELCLSYVEIPGDSAATGIQLAHAVTEHLFGEQGLADVGAISILAWETSLA